MKREITVKLDSEEIWPLLNILNEVCNGLHIKNFEKTIGEKKEFVVHLMNKISKEENKEDIVLNINNSELLVLKKTFEEVFKQIDDWEFQTRIGISTQEATKINNKIISVIPKRSME